MGLSGTNSSGRSSGGGVHRTATLDWTIVLAVTALALTLVVLIQTLAAHGTAYMAAPREVEAFLDAVDFSVTENESLDRDAARVPQINDKMRLGRLLREIQKAGDDLREDLNALLMEEDEDEGEGGKKSGSGGGGRTTLRTAARLLWRSNRRQLEDRMRRLDMLRMRFLVVYMGIVAGGLGVSGAAATAAAAAGGLNGAGGEKATAAAATEQRITRPAAPQKGLQRSLTEGMVKKAPTRRLTTTAIGHKNGTEGPHKRGWFGVVAELQRSPKMLQRHATIETAMAKSASP